MNTPDKIPGLRASVAAVQAALLTMALCPQAQADDALDPAVAALVQPQSTVEVGVGALSNGDYKANEYTGLSKKGAFFVGNFDLRGGGAMGSDDASRWHFSGNRLGTEARSLDFDYGDQGRFRLKLGYDELRRNRSDSYRTPLLGAGGTVLTLPGSWVTPLVPRVSSSAANARGLSPAVTSSDALVKGVPTAPTGAQLQTAADIQAADLPLFQTVDLYTKRTRFDAGAVFDLDRQWQLLASLRHEDKVGLKPMGTVTRAAGGDISTIIPDRIDQSTESFNLGFQYRADKLLVQGGYNGSLFRNKVPSMTWTSWASSTDVQTMSSAPDNQFHQLSLSGSYAFTPSTRLAANGAYGRSTQNESFLTASYTPLVPVSSLGGLVVTRTMGLHLSTRPLQALSLNAGYKFDQRDNRTPVNVYGFYDAGEAASGSSVFAAAYPALALGSNINLNANRPYSRRLNQLNLDADLRLGAGQALKAGVESQKIDRYCNGSWISCVDADTARENTLRLEWRATGWDTLQGRVALAHGVRKVDYNEDAWLALVPAANLVPAGAPGGASAYATMLALGLTGYGPVSGLNPLPAAGTAAAFYFPNNNAIPNALYGNNNRISELPGMRRYNLADRVRDKVRTSLDWQASEQLSLQAGLELNRDDYAHSVYGLQDAKSYALNLDASYAIGTATRLNAFASHEDQRSRSAGNTYTANSTATAVNGFGDIVGGCFATIALRNASNKVDPCLNWTATMRDKTDTFGAAFSQTGLAGGKLDIDGSVALSRARSTNDVAGGNYVNNPQAVSGATAGTPAAYYIAATALPVVTTNTVDLKLGGKVLLDKGSAVRVGYRYQHMQSSDWSYDGLQYGGLSGVLPTSEQAPNYTVHMIMVSYLLTFR